jgi:hypothetical protein
LKTLYLHCNYLYKLDDIANLKRANLPLISITIHGNPIETIPGFRLYIINVFENLKKIDSVLVSKKERDNSKVFVE